MICTEVKGEEATAHHRLLRWWKKIVENELVPKVFSGSKFMISYCNLMSSSKANPMPDRSQLAPRSSARNASPSVPTWNGKTNNEDHKARKGQEYYSRLRPLSYRGADIYSLYNEKYLTTFLDFLILKCSILVFTFVRLALEESLGESHKCLKSELL
ncbi:hypothetical protein L2E82_24688 [Cichorium intybus]|uniref:Uncharacterized protein n=1 Tax=Cichorium intybus TaxID=13427 RepID=A0ACB9E1Z1_CICIN|nr:hypothetical protein L2E82_24688 [Cichorium intybus]